jgi:DNA-binding CsgD family transcriptional regulator
VLDAAEGELAADGLMECVGPSPIVVLVGAPPKSFVLPAGCVWLPEPPADETAWERLFASVLKIEAARQTKSVAAVDSFCVKYSLSAQEGRLLQVSIEGLTNDEASAVLRCGRPTISTYWNRIFKKVGLSGQREILAAFARHALSIF